MNSEDQVPVDSTKSSLSRREALKQGAIAGGALLWVAPAVQAISINAAHAQTSSGGSGGTGGGGGSEPEDPPRAPPEVGFPSSIQLAVKRSSDGAVFGASFDGRGWGAIPSGGSCVDSGLRYSSPDEATAAAFSRVAVSRDSSSGSYRFALPDGYTLVAGHARCGQGCPPARRSGGQITFRCS